MKKKIFKVGGMSCAHCKKAVHDGLSSVPGVQNVDVDLENGTAEVTYDEVSADLQAMENAIIGEGYAVL